jgi:putative membrane protein
MEVRIGLTLIAGASNAEEIIMFSALATSGTGGFGPTGYGRGGFGPHIPPFVPFIGMFITALFIAAVVVLVVLLVRRTAALRRLRSQQAGPLFQAQRTLAERFARGDIDEVEYRERLEVLRANAAADAEAILRRP